MSMLHTVSMSSTDIPADDTAAHRQRELLTTSDSGHRHELTDMPSRTTTRQQLPHESHHTSAANNVARFGTSPEPLLVLHHRWSELLEQQLEITLSTAAAGEEPDAVGRAWRRTVETNPTLHAVLAAHLHTPQASAELRARHERDLRTIALAALLGDPGDPADELVRIGATLLALTGYSAPWGPHIASEAPAER